MINTKKMKRIFILTICFFSIFNTKAQKNDFQSASYNIGIGAIFSGIGALINKKPNEQIKTVLLKGMSKVAIGGYIVFESKRMIRNINTKKNWTYSWGGKILNSVGTSFIENAASNRKLWEQFNMNFGFIRVELNTANRFKIRPKIMPVALYGTIRVAVLGEFNIQRSLQTGELVFLNKKDMKNRGVVFVNSPLIGEFSLNDYKVVSHEFIHVYQYNDFNPLNTYFLKPMKKIEKKSNFVKKMNNWVYWDLQGIVLRPLYLLENRNRNCYFDNFFEHEAGYFGNDIICY